MKKMKEKQLDMGTSVSRPTTLELRGHQSVRATFRLSEACIDAITILSAQLGIKQKSVFDHLMEDIQTLKNVAREIESTEFDYHQRIQKTFVISRRSLSFLDMISSEYNAPRDALVEFSVRRLIPIIANERKKHEKRKQLLAQISEHFESGRLLLSEAQQALDGDDPIVTRLRTAMSVYQNALADIAAFIERGKIIEEFQSEQMDEPETGSD